VYCLLYPERNTTSETQKVGNTDLKASEDFKRQAMMLVK
jgi:hypothetical protein